MATVRKKAKPKKAPSPKLIYQSGRHPEFIKSLRSTGCTMEQIAAILGVAQSTLYGWAQRYPEVKDALEMGDSEANAKVVACLYKRATGYEYEETKTSIIQKADGSKDTKVEKTKKQAAPDVTAQIFWLKNRCPEEFADIYDTRHSGQIDVDSDRDDCKSRLSQNPEAQEKVRAAFLALYPGKDTSNLKN